MRKQDLVDELNNELVDAPPAHGPSPGREHRF